MDSEADSFQPRREKGERGRVAVWLVDPNAGDAALLVRAFRQLGVDQVVLSRNSTEAFARIAAVGATVPGVILLNLTALESATQELLQQIRRHPDLSGTPVVILASSRAEDATECYANGATAFLVKPLDWRQLVEMTREILSRWLR